MADQAVLSSSAVSIANSTHQIPAIQGSTERIYITPQNIRDFTFASTANSTFSGPVSHGGNTITHFQGVLTISTGTGAYILTSTNSGEIVVMGSSSTTKTVVVGAALSAGFNCTVTSRTTSDVPFVSSGGNLRHPDGHSRLNGQYASAAIYVVSSGEHYLAGNTQV